MRGRCKRKGIYLSIYLSSDGVFFIAGRFFISWIREDSACNVGDPGLIPGSGWSFGEGTGYSIQYSWASLMIQMVKNLPAMQCRRLGFDPWVGKKPWKRVWPPTPVFLPRESLGTEEPGGLQSLRFQRVRHDWATKHITAHTYIYVLLAHMHYCTAETNTAL